jgi:hypothetical protein
LPFACVISTDDDPLDNDGGDGGESGSSSTQGGSAGNAGNGGSSGSSMSGSGGGGQGGTDVFPAPVCTAEANDDECITCLKQQCCDTWRACDDFGCDEEWNGITLCVSDFYNEMQYADEDTLGMCTSENSVDESGFAQENTNDLIACIYELSDADAGGATRCGVPCFGTDIFIE